MRYLVYRETSFAAAHRLRNYRGKCENLHGHNWRVRVTVSRAGLTKEGFVMDFKDLDTLAAQVLEHLDHHDLNAVPPFDAINPTAEHIAQYIFEKLSALVAAHDGACRVEEVAVWESEKSCAIVERDR